MVTVSGYHQIIIRDRVVVMCRKACQYARASLVIAVVVDLSVTSLSASNSLLALKYGIDMVFTYF